MQSTHALAYTTNYTKAGKGSAQGGAKQPTLLSGAYNFTDPIVLKESMFTKVLKVSVLGNNVR